MQECYDDTEDTCGEDHEATEKFLMYLKTLIE